MEVNSNSLLDSLNRMNYELFSTEMHRCCGNNQWVDLMSKRRPFNSLDQYLEGGNSDWWSMSVADWIIAFSAHPKIGDKKYLQQKFQSSNQPSWEGEEQKGAANASEEVLQELADLNEEYFNKNGFVFLICATGKSAAEMLEALKVRMNNDRNTEVNLSLFVTCSSLPTKYCYFKILLTNFKLLLLIV